MMKLKAIIVLTGLLLVGGCGRKEAKTAQDLQQVFEKPAANSALGTAKPEVKVWVDQAVTALKADDQATAVMSLRSLRSSGELTVDQSMAVEDMMVRAQRILAERAARGDQQAINALNMLTINPR